MIPALAPKISVKQVETDDELFLYDHGRDDRAVHCLNSGIDADVSVVLRLDFPKDRVATILLNRVSHAPKKYMEMRLDCEQASLRVSLGGVARLDFGWNSNLNRPRFRFSLTKGGEARWERNGKSRVLAQQPHNAIYNASAAHFPSSFLPLNRL